MRAVSAKNLRDRVPASTPVNVHIHDLVPLSEFRLVRPEVRPFHRPALQSAEHVCHTAAVDALGIDLSRAFLPREGSQVPVSDPGSFERGDSGLRLPRMSITATTRFVRFRRACPFWFVFIWPSRINIDCQCKNRTLYRS
jgi:hypothetical protein